MLTREDIVRIVEAEILGKLEISVKRGDFTSPNDRTVILSYNGREIDRTTFDIKDTGEYEG